MKKVIKNQELYSKIQEAITLLCGTVKTTLGPKGNNVIVNSDLLSPFITNDGVTIAKNIASDDVIINTVLEIAKTSAIKTDDLVGDGTTSTLVILEELINAGIPLIKNGINPIILQQELNESLQKALAYLKKWKHTPTEKQIQCIAEVSSNDKEIGKIISKVYLKIQNQKGIKIIDTDKPGTEVIYYNGYIMDTFIASNYFFTKKDEIDFNNSKLLIIDGYLDNLEYISDILNEIVNNSLKLVIIAKDYSEEFINNIVSLYLENNINIILLKNPMYGERELILNKDLATISSGIVSKSHNISFNNVGNVKKIVITKEKTIISYEKNTEISKKIKELENSIKIVSSKYEKDYILERLAMFKNGLAIINVGAPTRIECIEKKMRYDDALAAVAGAKHGIIPGSGLYLFKLTSYLNSKTNGENILKKALIKPLTQILINAGLNAEEIIEQLKNNNYQKLYNVKLNKYEDILDTTIIDPYIVVENTLTNAISIASMLLTTSSIVINDNLSNSSNKISSIEE